MLRVERPGALKPLTVLTAVCICILSACRDEPRENAPAAGNTLSPDVPQLGGRVVDQADLLSAHTEVDISSKSEALQARTGRQFVVVTVNSLNGQDAAGYTRQLGNHWGIGDKDRDDGVILLVAPHERQVRVAVGDGLATTLTDARAKEIVDRQILPAFRGGRMSEGISAGSDALIRQLSQPLSNSVQ